MPALDGSAAHPPGTQRAYRAADMELLAYVPPGRRPGPGWPLVLFLHGAAEAAETFLRDERRWVRRPLEAVKDHGSPPGLCESQAGRARRLYRSCVVVSPQFPYHPTPQQRAEGRRRWRWADRVDAVDEILTAALAAFGGDAGRIFATGFSRGGAGAVSVAADLRRNRIARLVVVDSESGLDALPPRIPTWVFHAGPRTFPVIAQEHDRLLRQAQAGAWQVAPPSGLVPAARRLVTDLDLREVEPRLNHIRACRGAYADRRVDDWLLD